LGLNGVEIFTIMLLFVFLEVVLSRLLFRLRIRDRPY
jgi:hypothetical protein